MMYRDLEHPEITMALNTGYPSCIQEKEDLDDEDDDCFDDDYDQDKYEAYCDHLYEESRDERLFGDY